MNYEQQTNCKESVFTPSITIASLKPNHFADKISNPEITFPFHLIYFLLGVKE
jgi:hypothetical protein